MTYVDLRPDRVRAVQVLVDGTWYNGDLEAYRRDGRGSWSGYVRWSMGPGAPNHVGWYGEYELQSDGRMSADGDPEPS